MQMSDTRGVARDDTVRPHGLAEVVENDGEFVAHLGTDLHGPNQLMQRRRREARTRPRGTGEALDSRSSGKGQRREPLFVNGDYEVVPVLVQREVARATASLSRSSPSLSWSSPMISGVRSFTVVSPAPHVSTMRRRSNAL